MIEALAFVYGASNPVTSLYLASPPLPDCGSRPVAVQYFGSSHQPVGFFVIEGKYPVKLQSIHTNESGEQLGIPGLDGSTHVLQVGSAMVNFGVDDNVILRTHCRGTWRAHAVFEEDDLIRIPSTIDTRLASLLRMGVAPAYFLLREYQQLEPGDRTIQNAATGTIAHFICQLARLLGVGVISVIRNRSNTDEPEHNKRSLCSHGASLVLTEDEIDTSPALDGKRITLAIDSVSDDALARTMAACMSRGATLMTSCFLGATTARSDPAIRRSCGRRFGELFARGILKSWR